MIRKNISNRTKPNPPHIVLHTHECRLALILDEKQLTPVGAGRLHPEHHQVGHGQQPQVGGQQELGQRAFIAGGF